jgi:hypothetical protein
MYVFLVNCEAKIETAIRNNTPGWLTFLPGVHMHFLGKHLELSDVRTPTDGDFHVLKIPPAFIAI